MLNIAASVAAEQLAKEEREKMEVDDGAEEVPCNEAWDVLKAHKNIGFASATIFTRCSIWELTLEWLRLANVGGRSGTTDSLLAIPVRTRWIQFSFYGSIELFNFEEEINS